jgi:DNA polymerase-2
MRGFLLTPTYRVVNGVPEVHLYGVLESGEPCLIVDDRVRPYFFVRKSDVAHVHGLAPRLKPEQCDLQALDGAPVVRIHVAVPADVPPLRQRLEDHGIACFEADVRFAYRYLIDRGIRGAFEVEGESRHEGRLGRVFRNPEVRPAHWTPQLKILSIDIETNLRGNEVFAIALHTREFERVLVVHEHVLEKGEPVPSEKALIRRFLEYVHEIDPDVITGWNVVDFDLAVLSRAARRHGIRFAIGRNDEEFNLRKDMSFTRESRAIVFGRQVLDGLSLMRGAFIRLDDYKLETASRAFLSRGKLLAGDGRHTEIERLYREDTQKLVDYNLEDARLVLALLDKTRLIELAVERSLLTGMQLDRVSAAIASIDSLYLHNLRQRGFVAPSVGRAPQAAPIIGGYVMDSQPGLFRNVLVFDFKSLYPSIIRTFNLDPLTLIRGATSHEPRATSNEQAVAAPNGARFRRDVIGIIPELLAHLATERELAKNAGDGVKSNAIKILMNSFYGVLGAGTSRLFFPEVANAVTTFGQRIIKWAADLAREKGYDVIYGDTDSLFVHPRIDDVERAYATAAELREFIGAGVARHVEKQLGCHSYLELEFEKLYRRFMMPEVRGSKVGSKKRYAGLLVEDGKEEIEFVGLEAVRRDWSEVAKRFQRQLLWRVFHDEPLEGFIKEFVADLKAGKFDDQLVYKKAIRKDLEAYTKTTPPHVKAARKLKGEPGRIIAYVMTENGPEPAGELTAAPDYAHYIEHQLAPIGEAVMSLLGGSFEAIVPSKAQLALF